MKRSLAVTAGLGLLIIVAMAVITVVLGASEGTSWVELEPGDCFDLAGAIEDPGSESVLHTVDPLDCTQPHDAEVVATGRLDPDGGGAYPSDDELFDLVDRRCSQAVGDRLDRSQYGLLPIAPDERTWSGRNGHFACFAVVAGGGTVARSALD